MMITLIALVLVSVTYIVAATMYQKSVPESISAIVYSFGKPGRWMWTLWIWACAFLLAPMLIEAMPENRQFLSFLTISMLTFCGAMPLVIGVSNDAHNFCGIAAGIGSQLCVLYICHECLTVWSLLLIARLVLPRNTFYRTITLILEVICLLSVILALFFHYVFHL